MAFTQDIEIGKFNFVGESFSIERGVTNHFPISYRDTNGVPKDLSSLSARMAFSKLNRATKSYEEVFVISTDLSTIVLSDGVNELGTNILLIFRGVDIKDLDAGTYDYDFVLIDDENDGKYLLRGQAEINAQRTNVPPVTS
jgi:hypothetical protein